MHFVRAVLNGVEDCQPEFAEAMRNDAVCLSLTWSDQSTGPLRPPQIAGKIDG